MLRPLDCPKRWLLVVAAPGEARAVAGALGSNLDPSEEAWRPTTLSDRFDLLLTGVGKANAAAGTARAFDHGRHAGVINLGVAGSLPGSGLRLGDIVLGVPSVYADEGLLTPSGFTDVAQMGFPPDPGGEGGRSCSVMPSELLRAALRPLAQCEGPIATVSTCSGTDAAAAAIRDRTGALAEAMEGAAVAFTLRRLAGPGVPFIEVRAISNTTGDRSGQRWDLTGALARLSALVASL